MAINKNIYYVYEQFNPVTNEVFYVGEGKNSRIEDHWKDALKDSENTDNIKHKIIQDLAIVGFKPEQCYRIVKSNLTKDDAIKEERKLIDFYGLENLSNKKRGNHTRQEKLQKAKSKIYSIKIENTKPDEFGFTYSTNKIKLPTKYNKELDGRHIIIKRDPKMWDSGAVMLFLTENPDLRYGTILKNTSTGLFFKIRNFGKIYSTYHKRWLCIGMDGWDCSETGEILTEKVRSSSIHGFEIFKKTK